MGWCGTAAGRRTGSRPGLMARGRPQEPRWCGSRQSCRDGTGR